MKKKILIITILLFAQILMFGCSKDVSRQDEKKIKETIDLVLSYKDGYDDTMKKHISEENFYICNYVEFYSKEYNLDENLVYSIIKAESKFKEDAVSRKGAKGLMQIGDGTRDWAAEELKLEKVDIFKPQDNIRIGCWYLNRLYREFGDLDLVIAAYNGGSGNVKKWLADEEFSSDGENLETIPFKETASYVEKVKYNYEMYKKIYN